MSLFWNGSPVTPVETAVTGAGGVYTIPPCYVPVNGFGNPPVSVNLTLTIYFTGTATYLASNNTSAITITYCEVDADLASKFWVTRYRTPSRIEPAVGDTPAAWGAILCIDPNSLRADQKGPIYYLLDTCVVRPGLTDKSGGFTATINDNKTSIDSAGNQKRVYDMTLFEADTIYIRDNDEFWIGVQEGVTGSSGPVLDNESGLENSWSAGVGGRQWLLGGWVGKRHYRYEENSRITATIEGKDYMDLWKENFFGTSGIPRDYKDDAVDILQVVVDILADFNAAQDDDYEVRSHPSLFPGSPLTADVAPAGVLISVQDVDSFSAAPPFSAFIWDDETKTGETVTVIGVGATTLTIWPALTIGFTVAENAWIVMTADLTDTLFMKAFNNNADFSTMQDLCERADFEWKIAPYPAGTTPAERRRFQFYPRETAPWSGAPNIFYSDSIRDLPQIMVGNTTNLLTNALVTGSPISLPENTWDWINTGLWPDKETRHRIYSFASIPSPPNAYYNRIVDSTLILDDEMRPALNFQNDLDGLFQLYLSFFNRNTNFGVATLNMDLRYWRRLKFHFRHPTAESALIILIVNDYTALVGKTIVVTAAPVDAPVDFVPVEYYLVEGTDWTAAVSDNATAASIQAAIDGLEWASATVIGATISARGDLTPGALGFLSFVSSDADALDLTINLNNANEYKISICTENEAPVAPEHAWQRTFEYRFGTGSLQSSTLLNDPVVSPRDIVAGRNWSTIDILLPDVNTDGTIGDGTVASLTNDEYMHGWRPTYIGDAPAIANTADPTNIDFIQIYADLQESVPGVFLRALNGVTPVASRTFAQYLLLGTGAVAGSKFLDVTDPSYIAGDYASAVMGAPPSEARVFNYPYPKWVIWGDDGGNTWEEIEIVAIASSDSLIESGYNVLLNTPLEHNYPKGPGQNPEICIRGGWSICFSQLHFTLGDINKEATLPAHLANPKRFRLVSSDDLEYLVDVEGRADQELLDAASLQAVKITLDGDPRRLIGTRVRPYLDEQRFNAGLPTTFHGTEMIIEMSEHQLTDVQFVSVLMLSPLDTRIRERLMAMIQGYQESKLDQVSYGSRKKGTYQTK